MKIPIEIAEKVVTGSMKELWDTFINLEGEYEEWQDDYNDTRYGMKVIFEIYDLWENTNKVIRKDKDNKVIIDKKTYKLEDFRTEKEERRKIMVAAILNNTADKDNIAPRG